MSKDSKNLELSVEEQQIIADNRARQEKVDKANKAVIATLKKHNAQLVVDPNSPIGSPQIVLQLLK